MESLNKQRLVMRKLVKEAEESIINWSNSIIIELKPKSGIYAFFNHNAHVLERVKDTHRILERLYDERIQLRILDEKQNSIIPKDWPAGVPYPSNIQKLMEQNQNINEHLKMDFETLYIFGNTLLDQWSLCVAYAVNLPDPEKITFFKIVEIFENNNYDGYLNKLWQELGTQMLWLDGQIRFYRNKFIIHADRPWQRGNTRHMLGSDYVLFMPSPPGWVDDKAIRAQIYALLSIAPKWIQELDNDYWKKNPRALLEILLDNIGNIKEKIHRDSIRKLVYQFGTTTPTFQIVGNNILEFINSGTNLMKEHTKSYPHMINLGAPKISE